MFTFIRWTDIPKPSTIVYLKGLKAAWRSGLAHSVGSQHPCPHPGSRMWLWTYYLISALVSLSIKWGYNSPSKARSENKWENPCTDVYHTMSTCKCEPSICSKKGHCLRYFLPTLPLQSKLQCTSDSFWAYNQLKHLHHFHTGYYQSTSLPSAAYSILFACLF